MGASSQLERSSTAAAAPSSESPRSIRCVSSYERRARELGYKLIAGVDEVGRGCLFGPVTAAAVMLDPDRPIPKLRDSKIIDAGERAKLARHIQRRALCWAVGAADVYEIDQINIYQASRLAMRRAVEALAVPPDYLLIDALRIDWPCEQLPIIDGDARCRAIAAASILAKVHRDACLARWHEVFPQYNLLSNKGYSTPDHKQALREYGPTLMHRFSFWPVRASSRRAFWTGYADPAAAQGELFAETAEPACDEGEPGEPAGLRAAL